jgi:aminomethyltransferase
VPFNGWEMPLYYAGILEEHAAVRERVGLFDVSHMGLLTVSGEHAAELLARRTTADVHRMTPGQVHYAFWLNLEGYILDDLLLTRLDDGVELPPRFLVVPNAGRADRILESLMQHRKGDTEIARHNGRLALLAIQGPRARTTLEQRFGWALGGLRFYTARWFPWEAALGASGRLGPSVPDGVQHEVLVSRTGYTGELGYELLLPGERAARLAQELVEGRVTPCGLGARDTLRLEKGYLLSGQEFNLDHTPLEAGQERFVEMGHPFVGREALQTPAARTPPLRLAGLAVSEPNAIPRHGIAVMHSGAKVGTVTSGGYSPTLGHGIALAYLPSALVEPGSSLELAIRGRPVPAQVVALPFVPARPSPP